MSGLQQIIDFIKSIDSNTNTSILTSIVHATSYMHVLFIQSPKLFAINFDKLLTFLEQMNQGTIASSEQDRFVFMEFTLEVRKKYQKLFGNKKQRITRLFKICLDMFILVTEEPDQNWLNPPDGFSQELNPEAADKKILQIADELSQCVTFKETIIHFQPLFLEYIQNNSSWKHQHAALMIASQIAIKNSNVENLALFVQWAFMAAKHDHPQVRYAALQLIGQYSEDLNPEFQEKYYEEYVPLSLALFQDKVPRIVAHAFACTTNFFQNCGESWKIQSFIGEYINILVHYIQNGSTSIVQNAIAVLSTLSTTQNSFGPNLPNIFNIAFDILQQFKNKPHSKQILNQTLELITIAISRQNKKEVEQYIPKYLQKFLELKELVDPDYLLQSWRRVCISFDDFSDLSIYFPLILSSAKGIIDNIDQQSEEEGDTIEAIIVTFQSFKQKAAPYAAQTMQFAKTIFQNIQNISIQEKAILLITTIISQTKPVTPDLLPTWLATAQQFFAYVSNLIENKLEWQNSAQLPFLFEAHKNLMISMASCLTNNNDILILSEKYLGYTKRIIEIIQSAEDKKDEQKMEDELEDDQDLEMAKECVDKMDQCCDHIPDIFKQIIKLATDHSTKLSIVEKIQIDIEENIVKRPVLILFVIHISITIFQVLEYSEISSVWPKLTQVYIQFSTHCNPRIRNGALYGLNLIIKKSPSQILGKKEVSNLIQIFSNAFTMPFEEPHDKFYINHSKDNTISALGTLLKYHSQTFPEILNEEVFNHWVNNLPLNTDKTQGNNQHEFLLEILAHKPSFLIKNAEHLRNVLQIFGKFILKRKDKEFSDVVKKTKQSLEMMKEWSMFKENIDYLWTNLSNSHKNALTQLMNSDS